MVSARHHGSSIFSMLRALFLVSACFVLCYLLLLFEIIETSPSLSNKNGNIRLQKLIQASSYDQGTADLSGRMPKRAHIRLAATESLSWEAASAHRLVAPQFNFAHAENDASKPLSEENYLNDPSFETNTQSFNTFKRTKEDPVSTFSADVDTTSYTYIRRLLQSSFQMPAPNTVRTEELINYFDYDYPSPQEESTPLEASVMISESPWSAGRKIMSIGIKGYDPSKVADRPLPKSNLVFLVDVSGSMSSPDRLPLVKESLELLLGALQPKDHVSIVTYASGTSIALPPTPVFKKESILTVIRSLNALGSTNGSGGLEMAYQVANENFDNEAVNRIMLFSDGDFNVGLTQGDVLKRYVSQKRDSGIFLSVFGFGSMGQYRDETMKVLANNGNGVAVYIDSIKEAQKVLVQQAQSTLNTIAKDVKFLVEFNPNRVSEYRLIGYEKRLLAREDFNNDAVDAGEIGAGHTVTVLYEFTPVENDATAAAVDDLRYGVATALGTNQKPQPMLRNPTSVDHEYGFLKMRYKLPREEASKLATLPITDEANQEVLERQGGKAATIAREFRFAIAVAGFAELLKGKIYEGRHQHGLNFEERHRWTWSDVIDMAEANLGHDAHQYRREFVNLVHTAKSLSGK